MSRLPTGRPGQALALLLLACVMAASWFAVAAPLLDFYADRTQVLESRATLARRMAQVAATLPGLQEQAASRRPGTTSIVALDGASDAIAAAALTQALQAMAVQAGAPLASTEVLPAEQQGAYRRIAVKVALNASYTVLIGLLQAIDSSSQGLLSDDLQVHGTRGFIRDAAMPLEVSLVVTGFRAGS